MPSWKKVILSGSDAALNSLSVTTNVTASSFTGSFTGSFLGTASYADQALSASFALTASYASNVPLTASYALQAESASFAISASYAPGTSQTLQQVTDNGNTTTNSITAASFTGSLQGTASYASQALSSSYALTASYAPNLVISGSINNVDYIDFNTTATVTQPIAGRLSWNNSDGTLDLGMKGGNVTQQIGEEIFYEVRNETGTSLANGTSVYASGVTTGSGRITAAPFVADGSIEDIRYLGLATEDILNGVNGFVTHFGYVRDLDTRGTDPSSIAVGDENWAAGDILYAHPTVPGKLTNVQPQNAIVVCTIIVRNQSAGVVFVRPSTYGNLLDLNDVNINTGSLSTGDLLIYDSGSNLWINSKQLSGSYAVTGSWSATSFTGSLQGTASYASQALASDTSISASHAIFADTASFLPSDTNLNITSISASNAVFQSASIGFLQTVTGSATIIGDAFIILNTNNAQRYAGIIVEDSGSATPVNYTASLQFDSQTNDWFYEYTSSSDPDNFGIVLFGPEYGTKGSPTYLTNNRIPKGDGGHHLNDSNISDDGTTVSINSNTQVTGSLNVSTNITAESLNITSGTGSFTGSFSGVFDGISAGQIATGTGTVNTIAKWNTTSSLTDSSVTDDGSNVRIAVNTTVTGSIINNNAGFTSTTFTSGSSIANAATNEVIFTIDATVYESLAMEYVIFDSGKTNKRAGTFRSTWDDNTSAVVFDETTTTDIGNTSEFTLDVSNDGAGTISVRATNNVGSAMTIIYERKLLG